MIGAQMEVERGVVMAEGEERVFDAIRNAIRTGGGLMNLDEEMREFLLRVREKLEEKLWKKSAIFKAVDFSPFLRRIISEIEEPSQ